MTLNFALMQTSIPLLIQGAWVTLQVATLATLFGFIVGTVIGYLHTQKTSWLRIPINIFVGVIRGTPMLVQITFFYYVLPTIGLELSAFWAAVLAIGVNSTAYLSQLIKSGILSVGSDQAEAAQVLGLTKLQTARYIIMPQAVRVIIPALISECVVLVKDSSLASVIGVMELYKQGRAIMNQSYEVISVFCLVTMFYLVITTAIEILGKQIERKMNWYVNN